MRQTLKEIEVVCIDDGSTDKSKDIIREYILRDSRVNLIEQPNSGVASARNRGLGYSTGKFIGFLDSDDWVDDNYFEELYNTTVRHDSDIARAYMSAEIHESATTNTVIQNAEDYSRRYNADIKNKINENKLYTEGSVYLSIYKRTLLKDNKITFPLLHASEDEIFSLLSGYYANKIVYVSNPVYYHRLVRGGSLVTSFTVTEEGLVNKSNYILVLVQTLNALDDYPTDIYSSRVASGIIGVAGKFEKIQEEKTAMSVAENLASAWDVARYKEQIVERISKFGTPIDATMLNRVDILYQHILSKSQNTNRSSSKNQIPNSVKRVQSAGLCVGSGVDDVIDNGVTTQLDQYGQYTVDYRISRDPRLAEIVMNSDDSLNEDDIAESLFAKIPKIEHNHILGYHLGLYVGYIKPGTYRKNASSGGFTSWVATRLLEEKKIDGFIHVKKSTKPGLIFEYGISRTVNEIRSGAKSRYYPAELSAVLDEVKRTPGTYAVVGIPEIITELRLLARKDKIIEDRIKYYFGLVCGHQKTTKYAEAIAWEYGIKPGDLEDIDFRVKRKTGRAIEYDMKFTGKIDGESRTFVVRNNEPFVSSWAHGFFKARFSDFTDNTFNELADITFGDAWLEEYADDPRGNNILIVRNPEIANLLDSGIKSGEAVLDRVDEETIIRSQRGLVHHTRDELPYRLSKEIRRSGWAPKKRALPDDSLEEHRKKVQDIRQEIAEKSHVYYQEAVERDDFNWFKHKMLPLVQKYNELYGLTVKKDSATRKLTKLVREKQYTKADGAILTLTGYFNYGNVIQRYALQKFLKQNGYNFISYLNRHGDLPSEYRIGLKTLLKTPLRFIKRFMNYQKPYWYVPTVDVLYPEVYKSAHLINFVNKNIWSKSFNLADNYNTYIVGSDQVWRNWWNDRETLGYYFLNFLKGRKLKRIAYAASFGKDNAKDVMSKDDVEYVSPYVKSFDHISVREKSGIDILNNTWDITNVTEVVDPTLLLDAADYSNLIESTDTKYENIQPIFAYILSETPELKGFVRKVQDHRKQAVTKVLAHGGANEVVLPPVEFWLKGYRDAELVVTNSFHGMMFSIINNTDFIVIGKESGGLSRILDFLNEYGIEGRFVEESQLNSFDLTILKPINWESVNKKLTVNRQRSATWILDAIKSS